MSLNIEGLHKKSVQNNDKDVLILIQNYNQLADLVRACRVDLSLIKNYRFVDLSMAIKHIDDTFEKLDLKP